MDLFSVDALIGVLTLTIMEIVLGIDNIIFIAIIADKLPKQEQPKARKIGLALALIVRVVFLLGITTLIKLKDPVLTIVDIPLSIKDLILMAGGVFLVVKSLMEIFEKLAHDEKEKVVKGKNTMAAIITQIVLIDIVFSFDSILAAVALVQEVAIMIAAVIVSMIIMMMFSGPIADYINKRPSLQILALSFLVLIGAMLFAEAIHHPIEKAYVYTSVAFALIVELVNLTMDKKAHK